RFAGAGVSSVGGGRGPGGQATRPRLRGPGRPGAGPAPAPGRHFGHDGAVDRRDPGEGARLPPAAHTSLPSLPGERAGRYLWPLRAARGLLDRARAGAALPLLWADEDGLGAIALRSSGLLGVLGRLELQRLPDLPLSSRPESSLLRGGAETSSP